MSYIYFNVQNVKCNILCVGKSETQFNITLNEHLKGFTRKGSIPASNHEIECHDSKLHVKFIIIEQLNHVNLDKSTASKVTSKKSK